MPSMCIEYHLFNQINQSTLCGQATLSRAISVDPCLLSANSIGTDSLSIEHRAFVIAGFRLLEVVTQNWATCEESSLATMRNNICTILNAQYQNSDKKSQIVAFAKMV